VNVALFQGLAAEQAWLSDVKRAADGAASGKSSF